MSNAIQQAKEYLIKPTRRLNPSECTAYVLTTLLTAGTSYPTQMAHALEDKGLKVSETILNTTIKALINDGVVQSKWEKGTGKGRTRRMLTLDPAYQEQASVIADLWNAYIGRACSAPFQNG